MTRDQKIFIFSILFVAACGNLFFVSKIKADSETLGQEISEQKLELGSSGSFVLSKRLKNDQKIWVLTEVDPWRKHNIILNGFEDDISVCSHAVTEMDAKTVVCLKGIVGVHSQNYVFFDSNKLQVIKFKNTDLFVDNVYSDVPAAILNGKTLFVDNRDYDKDPINDSNRTIFQFDGDKFVFDKKINITYDEKNNNLNGVL